MANTAVTIEQKQFLLEYAAVCLKYEDYNLPGSTLQDETWQAQTINISTLISRLDTLPDPRPNASQVVGWLEKMAYDGAGAPAWLVLLAIDASYNP